ncbi:hypothetical protein F5Y11DRAFT_351642 [Daldinia sp. FL1419]|nr:hypothetical protein F5Y11DRAFT_351642 [Daldinia sp. FL1419]
MVLRLRVSVAVWLRSGVISQRRPTPMSFAQLSDAGHGGVITNVGPPRNSIGDESPGETPKFHTWPFILNDTGDTTSRAPLYESLDKKTYEEYLTFAREILVQLKFLLLIEKPSHEYFPFRQVALVPRPVILQLVASIRSNPVTSGYAKEDATGDVEDLSRLAKAILRAPSSEITMTPSLDLEQICELFSGDNPRNLSLRIARELSTQTNDIINWLAYENLQLMMLVEGDAGLSVWRIFGDLVTDLFALGLHREVLYSAEMAPFFILECRRKTFAIRDPSRTLPSGISGSLLIWNLSVLVSHLESATSPGETNNRFCIQAAKFTSRNLDQILSSFNTSFATPAIPLNPAQGLNNGSEAWGFGTSDLDNISFSDFDSPDFETWVMDINLNAINAEWNIH